MKIKKYQNPDGTMTRPMRRTMPVNVETQKDSVIPGYLPKIDETYVREKEEAAAAEAAAKYKEEQQRLEQQRQVEAERARWSSLSLEDRISELQERTSGLTEADSPTDWYYAMTSDPAKRQEWDEGAKLARNTGLTLLSLPYAFKAGKDLINGIRSSYNYFTNALNNPITREPLKRGATKLLTGMLLEEAISQGADSGKTAIDNSEFAETPWGRISSLSLAALPWFVDGDSVAGKRLLNQTTNMTDDVLALSNIPVKDRKQQRLGHRMSDHVDAMAQVDGDLLLETFPPKSEYFEGLGEGAQQLYEDAVRRGDAFVGNGGCSTVQTIQQDVWDYLVMKLQKEK